MISNNLYIRPVRCLLKKRKILKKKKKLSNNFLKMMKQNSLQRQIVKLCYLGKLMRKGLLILLSKVSLNQSLTSMKSCFKICWNFHLMKFEISQKFICKLIFQTHISRRSVKFLKSLSIWIWMTQSFQRFETLELHSQTYKSCGSQDVSSEIYQVYAHLIISRNCIAHTMKSQIFETWCILTNLKF